ncbi:MAG: glycosyltransferase [Deltaproteobacteria bacterium]|nr:glycosyltransferase [Deltaproteobacteria bacterium]
MRILFILRNAEGGIRTHVETLIRGALEQGHDCLLITDLKQADSGFQKTLSLEPEIRKRVVSISMRSAPGPWDLSTLWLLSVGLRSARKSTKTSDGTLDAQDKGVFFDAVHGHGAKGGLFARLCRILRILPRETKVIYTPHGGSLHQMHGNVMNVLYTWIERFLGKYTDCVLAESQYSADQFIKRIGTDTAPVVLNRNGIDPIEPVLSPWPEGLGRTSPLKIAAFGLLREIKGFDVLIQAVHLLKNLNYKVELEISGEGKSRESLEKLVRDLNLESTVTINRETSNALSAMREAQIVVQPSRFESFGLVSLEAQATGCAVIASKVGGLVDVVDDKRTGILVEPGQPQALCDAIKWFIENPNEAQTMRARAARRAQEDFSSEKMIDGALRCYQETQLRTTVPS